MSYVARNSCSILSQFTITDPRRRSGFSWYKPDNRQSALTWVVALLVVVAATDGIALFYMSRIMNTVYADLGTDDLEFANPYHGLDALYSSGTINSSKIEPMQNIPRVVAQVFSDRPKELAPVGEHDLFNKVFGTLSPHEKHLHVSPSVSLTSQPPYPSEETADDCASDTHDCAIPGS